MLFKGCKFKPVDNSGIKLVRCVRIISKTKKFGLIGDLLGVVIRKFKQKKKLLKKTIYYGLIISTKYPVLRKDGIKLVSDKNRIILMSNKLVVFGSRIVGPIYKEVRNQFIGKGRYRRWRFDKVVSYAKKVI